MSNIQHIGRVKWFNNKNGYGFITVTDGELSGTDVFVHHSGLVVQNPKQFIYLVEGEYVQLNIVDSSKEGHKHQAVQVTGVHGGKLMCETRHEKKTTKKSGEEAL